VKHDNPHRTSSSEIAVTPALAAASIESAAVVGERNEIVRAPFLSDFICSGVSEVTEATTSASLMTLPLLTTAPAALNSESENPDETPAPDSITTSRPAFVNLEIMSGTSATLASPARISLATAIRIRKY
jgi:hypothetical protein